ncbi:MAG TPA: peptidoglycan-binding protein [Allosphingosinicella sp.]|nr:peptidoglycan-binding protein [Allosphingosinicella sp.]
MAELTKAKLIELDQDFKEKPGGKKVTVQFNPDTLKVSFANQVVPPQGGDQSSGNKGYQFVGTGTTKLALTLWFDVTAMTQKPVDDVRRLTGEVIYFMTPQPDKVDNKKLIPPGVRFCWGSLLFDGIVDSLEESLEFFAPDGKPLRASVNLSLSQKKILVSTFTGDGKALTKGTKPLSPAKLGDTLQALAGDKGKDGGWQGIAAANGIEDPLRLKPGQLIDLSASAAVGGGFGVN